jgi:Zn-finger nucleic acid-binding protein
MPDRTCPARRAQLAKTCHAIDLCETHGTWIDRDELPQLINAFAEERAGEISNEALQAAGVPGGLDAGLATDDEAGFFTRLFRDLFKSLGN